MKILGLITARGGSKGIPGKNIAPAGGKPLIVWTVDEAKKSASIDRLVLSTDDAKIAEVCAAAGCEVPFTRPAELAGDASSHYLVVEHAVKWLEDNQGYIPDYVMLLQPTTPLRTHEDIDAAAALASEKNADCVVTVSEIPVSPCYSRVINKEGLLEDFFSKRDVFNPRRQEVPVVYSENGAVYLIRRDTLLSERSLMPSKIHASIMPQERTLDIDSPWNLHLADLILRDRQR
jgi:CMP-N-acetylneuraminic acid synthetase